MDLQATDGHWIVQNLCVRANKALSFKPAHSLQYRSVSESFHKIGMVVTTSPHNERRPPNTQGRMNTELETHPHSLFVPENARVLIIGSFPGRNNSGDKPNEWFYSAQRNQFWRILRAIYNRPLATIEEKKQLFTEKGIAIGDLFLTVKRKKNTNSDSDLEIVQYNEQALQQALEKNAFEKILATSQFVKKEFEKLFPERPHIEALPSPSPRYARLSLAQKINEYRRQLPQ